MASKRLLKEFRDLANNPPENWILGIKNDNLFEWEATLMGPPATPYYGGRFNVLITFPQDFPFKRPEVTFLTKICHPNINTNGYICWITRALGTHSRLWNPSYKVSKVFDAIISVLNEPDIRCSMDSELRDMYLNDKAKYEETVRQWTRKYAMDEQDVCEDVGIHRGTVQDHP